MTGKDPVAEPLVAEAPQAAPWREAHRRLAEADLYWLATVRPDGRPHAMPVLAIWLEDAIYFCAGPSTRKARNLAHNAHCVITVDSGDVHLVVEGQAIRVTDDARLQDVTEAYAAKYDWQVTIRDSAFYADGAPTAGPPPYEVYEVIPVTVFGFGTNASFSATRWRF